MSLEAKIKVVGSEFKFNEEVTLIVPPLNYQSLEQHGPALQMLGKSEGEDAKMVTTLVFEALRRNYPNITREEVAELLDIRNAREAFRCVMNLSGLKGEEPGKTQS